MEYLTLLFYHKKIGLRLTYPIAQLIKERGRIWTEGFPCGSVGKESTWNVGDLGLIPGLGRSPGEGQGYPLQYSGLENSMDCIVHGVTESQTRLSNCTFTFQSDSITYYYKLVYYVSCVSLYILSHIGKEPNTAPGTGWLLQEDIQLLLTT